MRSVFSTLAIASLIALLAGCSTLAPTDAAPTGAVPTQWPTGAAYAPATTSADASTLPWRDFVQDSRLRQVIEQALANNRDLRAAAANVVAARASYRVTAAADLPTLNTGMSTTRARSAAGSNGNGGTATSFSQTASASVGLSAYEIDLFGKQASQSQSALESFLATEAGARATRISLIAETAQAWLTLAADQSLLKLAQDTQQSAASSVEVTRQRQGFGVASAVDVRQAETVYQQARADVAAQTTAMAQARNALQLLVGAPVDDALIPGALADDSLLAQVPAGLSSSVLLQRPDVQQAEHTLLGAQADIGAARAALLPSLSLTTSAGLASAALSSLFTGGAASVWSLAPSLSWSLFDGGAARATVAKTQAQREAAVAAYEKALQTGFQEVADALARRGSVQEQLDAQTALLAAAQDSQRLADARYQQGVATYLAALEAQRTAYSAGQSLISLRLVELGNRVTLYRALGGGLAEPAASGAQVANN
ncbi:efflux transporter outer membrane subunit [Ideonella azotifigens]|uniref:TolC family protein n=2 Tax=Ideonella azotifigens TaxID=513160 RepID=A0ABP3V5B6_9BURK|nr:efflux transporter outer membrane subunit [Ideonella azotifigens]MCD2341250.1 efflux transporter outer membrane subunit [Ideonella azotifigens]